MIGSAALLTLAIAAVPAFLASIVEWVEAFTIVLAVGNTRGWRSPIRGVLAGMATLAVIVGVFGTPLIIFHEQVNQSFHIVVGILLLLFGMRWLRKAILRFAGIVALHDEELIYQREVAELRAPARPYPLGQHRLLVLVQGRPARRPGSGVHRDRAGCARRTCTASSDARRAAALVVTIAVGRVPPQATDVRARELHEVRRRGDADDLWHLLGRRGHAGPLAARCHESAR